MPTSLKAGTKSNVPYCNNCGYDLTGCTDSSKCPECGRPLVEVLVRGSRQSESGKRYRSKATLFGLPVVDIALGPKDGELRGKAKGIIAIGDVATGFLAIGGLARGVVAIGGMAIGGFSIGGGAIGLFTAVGGGALGGIAAGGGAIGVIANGGGSLGLIAQGGGAVGWCARGGGAVGFHVIDMRGQASQTAVDVFNSLSWFFGSWPPRGFSMFLPMVYPFAAALLVGGMIAILAMVASRQGGGSRETFDLPKQG